jgi:hypothetical protein
VALAEAQTWRLNPRDNRKELMEVIVLRRLLHDAEVDHVAEARRLAFLVRGVSKVLVDLRMPPIPGASQRCIAVVVVIFEHLQEAYASGHGPWD